MKKNGIFDLGIVEDTPCPDCGASFADVVESERHHAKVMCGFCGHLFRTKPVKAAEGVFVFPEGRFAGMTIGQAFEDARGPDYVRWAAASHKLHIVKQACEKWLRENGHG
jgi:hypothetical protein